MTLPIHRILLVEDDPQVRPMVGRFLRNQGFIVTEAADGLAAWEAALREPFDLVITDTHMPGLIGPELVARIRERHPTLPIMHLTGSSSRSQPQPVYPRDVPELMKPFDLAELLRMVHTLLARRAG